VVYEGEEVRFLSFNVMDRDHPKFELFFTNYLQVLITQLLTVCSSECPDCPLGVPLWVNIVLTFARPQPWWGNRVVWRNWARNGFFWFPNSDSLLLFDLLWCHIVRMDVSCCLIDVWFVNCLAVYLLFTPS